MIVLGCQRARYVMIRHDRILIGDAEAKLHPVVDLKPAKHDTWADQELVSVDALAARPLRVIQSKFRPEIFQKMILQGRVADE